jgi:hypothetical protein
VISKIREMIANWDQNSAASPQAGFPALTTDQTASEGNTYAKTESQILHHGVWKRADVHTPQQASGIQSDSGG